MQVNPDNSRAMSALTFLLFKLNTLQKKKKLFNYRVVICVFSCSDLPSDVSYYSVDLYNRNKRSKDVLVGMFNLSSSWTFFHLCSQGNVHIAAFLLSPTIRTNPSRKRSFSKTLFKPEEFESADFAFSYGRKTFGKRSFTKTMTSR